VETGLHPASSAVATFADFSCSTRSQIKMGLFLLQILSKNLASAS
jgi:hypothetical protein